MRRQRAERARQYSSVSYRQVISRLALNVRRLRTLARLTQEEAAFRGDMSTQLFQRVEAGSANVTATTIARLCDALGVDVGRLFVRPRGRG